MTARRWTKEPYGHPARPPAQGRWVISDGICRFEVSLTIDGSGGRLQRHDDGYIVSPEEADEYAEFIVNCLNGEAQ